jgi:hypothetical protein
LLDGAEQQRLSWPTAQENLRLVSPVAATSKVARDRKIAVGDIVGRS